MKNGKYSIGPSGISDIVGTLEGGRSIYIEVKRPGEKLRENQRAFLKRMESMGAMVMVVESLDEVMLWGNAFPFDLVSRLPGAWRVAVGETALDRT